MTDLYQQKGELLSAYTEPKEKRASFVKKSRSQKTIERKVSQKGKTLFSGIDVTISFLPAKEGTGIVFKRVDLEETAIINATIENLFATPRTTIIGKNGVFITCTEHLLSAIFAFNIDNIIIELDGGEPPIFDGSSKEFVSMLEKAEVVELKETVDDFFLQTPISVELDGMILVALASNTIKYSYTLSYPGEMLLDAQFYEHHFSFENYKKQIAPARTFATLKEVEILIEKQIIKNTSLDTAIVLDGGKVISNEGLRFSNEMARHKILDLMGDLALVGKKVIAHFISIKGGHNLNTLLAKKLSEEILKG